MKKWLIFLCLALVLTGCGRKAGAGNEDTETKAEQTEAAVQEMEAANVPSASEKEEFTDYKNAVEFLEQFEPELEFHDMDEEKAQSYGEPLKDAYTFIGRETKDGFGYVLAVLDGKESPLTGLSISGYNDTVVAGEWVQNGETSEEVYVYTFDKIEGLYRGEESRILYFQPDDLAEPGELLQAFIHQYCMGDEGVRYLADLVERGVRMTPPEQGAFLSVDRFENGEEYVEYIPLTREQEKEILESDMLIDPAAYGGFGLQLYVSEEEYEKNGDPDSHISLPALEIAREKCRFQIVELSEIHDIVKAEMKMRFHEWDKEGTTVISAREETETLTEKTQLAKLEEILGGAEPFYEGKCPYTGILTLTRADGEEIVLHLAADSCDGFVIGSHAFYSPGKEETARLWELFPGMRENTGWKEEN